MSQSVAQAGGISPGGGAVVRQDVDQIHNEFVIVSQVGLHDEATDECVLAVNVDGALVIVVSVSLPMIMSAVLLVIRVGMGAVRVIVFVVAAVGMTRAAGISVAGAVV